MAGNRNATVNGTVTRLVGACHENGFFYVLRTGNMTAPLWQRQIGTATTEGADGCLAGATYDGIRLFLADEYLLRAGGQANTLQAIFCGVDPNYLQSCPTDGSGRLLERKESGVVVGSWSTWYVRMFGSA